VFDNPDVRKCLPEKSAQFSVQVADLPRGDGNVGVEEMMRGLGLSANENNAALRESSPTPSEAEASEDGSDVTPGYKTLDVQVEWACTSLLFYHIPSHSELTIMMIASSMAPPLVHGI